MEYIFQVKVKLAFTIGKMASAFANQKLFSTCHCYEKPNKEKEKEALIHFPLSSC
jgi:hypothetical protein